MAASFQTADFATKSAPVERLCSKITRSCSPRLASRLGVASVTAPLFDDTFGAELFHQELYGRTGLRQRHARRRMSKGSSTLDWKLHQVSGAATCSPKLFQANIDRVPRSRTAPLMLAHEIDFTEDSPSSVPPMGCRNAEEHILDDCQHTTRAASFPTFLHGFLAAPLWMRVVILFLIVVVAGTATNVAFEFLGREEPQCASVLTLMQYVSVVAGALPRASEHILRPRIPRRWHLLFALLMTTTAVCGNKSVDLQIPFPMYLIIKSSNLVSNMCLGGLLLGKTYHRGQVCGVLLMTCGVVSATFMANTGSLPSHTGGLQAALGSVLCLISTVSMSLLSCAQEHAFALYGKHYEEALFYAHAIGLLPILYFDGAHPFLQMRRWCVNWQDSAQLELLASGIAVPRVWVLLLINLGCCHACKHGFFALLGATSSLTATLAIISYRFIGICLSAFVFNAPPYPPAVMSFGISLVILGGFTYLFYSHDSIDAGACDEDAASDVSSDGTGSRSTAEPQPEPSPMACEPE